MLTTALSALLALLLTAGVLATALAVQGTDDHGPSLLSVLDPHRGWRVAGDAGASVADVVGVGVPVVAVVSGTRTLVVWRAEPDDDEGANQAVWRLRDAAGRVVAQGRLGLVSEAGAIPDVVAVPDGFVVRSYRDGSLRHVGPDGAVTPVPSRPRRLPARAGDVLLPATAYDGPLWVYRPSDHAAHRLPRLPGRNLQRVVLDADGRVWALPAWGPRAARVLTSPGGAGPWTRTRIPLPRRGSPMTLAAVGDRVVVPVGTMAPGAGAPRLGQLWSAPLPSSVPGARPVWSQESAAGLDLAPTLEPTVAGLPGRGPAAPVVLLVGDDRGGLFRQRPAGGFERIGLPAAARDTTAAVSGPRVFLTGSRDRRLYLSGDAGRTWGTVAR